MENQKFSPAFEHALNFIQRPDIEGVYVNDPTDRGGETKYGISDRRDGVIDGKTDDRDEFHRLQLDISNLRGEIKELGPSIRQVSRISDLLLENELKEKN